MNLRILFSAVILFVAMLTIEAQDQLKIMQYNLLNYGNITTYCTVDNNLMLNKEQYLRTIIAHVQPDIFGANELAANTYIANRILDSVMNYQSNISYARGDYFNTAGGDLVSMLYFNTQKLALAQSISVQNHVRDIILYRLYYKSPNLAQTHDTVWINCIVGHLKAGSTSADQSDRSIMTSNVMSYLNQNAFPGNYVIMGDFNLQSSNETSYQNLTASTAGIFRFYDPINKSGSWNNNSSFANIHSQSTHSTSNGCASSGGMDDRFDFILLSNDIMQGNDYLHYQVNSYQSVGNDGNHYNQSINSGTNNSVPAMVLQALYEMSDHLPTILTLNVDASVSSINVADKNNSFYKIVNPTNENLYIYFANSPTEPIEVNIYSINGQLLLHNKVEANTKNFQTPVGQLASGIYILEISNIAGVKFYSKIVKQ